MTKVVRRGVHTYGYLLIIATIITVFAALTTIGVSAEVIFDTNYYNYNGEEGVTIIGFNGLNGGETVVIPDTIEGKKVLAIGLDGVVTTARVPGAEKIGVLDLTQVKNLKVILPHVFYGCSNINGTLKNNKIEKVGTSAFNNYSSLKDIILKNNCSINFYRSCVAVHDDCTITYVNDKGDVVKTINLR